MAGRDNARSLAQPKGNRDTYVLAGVIGAVAVLSTVYSLSRMLAMRMRGEAGELSWNPIVVAIEIAKGKGTWGREETIVAGVLVALLAALALGVRLLVRGTKKPEKKTRVDSVAKHLAGKDDIKSLGVGAARQTATRLHGEEFAKKHPGLRFGHEVSTGAGLYGGWEDLHLIIAGPRIGKTTSSVIPAIIEAPGVVVTTSNKADIVHDTINLTSARGTAWVFDPQGLTTQGNHEWFYDPLSYIRADADNMDAAAGALAAMFAAPHMPRGGGGDSYFPSTARTLLTGLLLVAALENRPISDVLLWASNERSQEAVELLAQYDQYSFWAKTLNGIYGLTDKTRSGVFGQAQNMVSVFARAEVRKWVEPQAGRAAFSPYDFVRSGSDTLYLLSKEGPRSVGILTTILTVAVMEAAEGYGEEQANGRMPVPMVCPLDEVANTVLWEELPAVVSHYGSRGIIILAYLQSYSQGINAWGKEKMEALWSAMTIKCVGGGITDEELTKRMSELIGTHEEYQSSSSFGSHGERSVQRSVREKQTMTAAEIAALPKGRWLVQSVGRRPMIGVTEPYFERKWDAETNAILAAK